MDFEVSLAKSLGGIVQPPGDKSISHRAVIIGALSVGDTFIENFLTGEDCLATVSCFKELGVEFTGSDNSKELIVHGRGPEAMREPEKVLDAANSGTTIRLLTGILAGLPFFSVITGDFSLRRRPMRRVTVPLREMGARIWGRQGGELAPLAIYGGGLHGTKYEMPVASAQLKSAILLAGLFARGWTTVIEPMASRDHTERMLKYFGAALEISENTISIQGQQQLSGKTLKVPGDISSAAFFLVAGAITQDSEITVKDVGVNPTRTGILEALEKMGANLKIKNRRVVCGEPVADIEVRSSSLRGTVIAGDLIPRLIDEIPVLAVAAAAASGETVITDAAELKVKESNRLAVVAEELRKFGVDIEEIADGLVIKGGRPLKGAVCNSHGDHRIAMAMTVAGLIAIGRSVIRGAECVNISFPDFYYVLNSLREK
jgi:3-phosphoshikimate 1-carboxyvinyltransferase